MLASSIPSKFSIPFANSAGGAYIRAIPTASQIGIVPGAASLTDGFPPLNFLPTASGGIPPAGEDHNGILNQITKWSQWMAAGGQVPYDSVFSAAIGGYPSGAILLAASGTNLWISTADNNTTDPDTGGAGWVNLTAGRLLRTLRYRIVSGTQYVSINGGTDTTSGAGTYTPIAGMMTAIVKVQGGGGAGGGAVLPGAGLISLGAPGAPGAYGEWELTAAMVGSSQAVTTGGGGAAVSGGNGNNGAPSSLGTLAVASGGQGGGALNSQTAPVVNGNGTVSPAPTGAGLLYGEALSISAPAFAIGGSAAGQLFGGTGGASHYGVGGLGNLGNALGIAATNPGSGGAGVAIGPGYGTNAPGTNGAAGMIIIEEYS